MLIKYLLKICAFAICSENFVFKLSQVMLGSSVVYADSINQFKKSWRK